MYDIAETIASDQKPAVETAGVPVRVRRSRDGTGRYGKSNGDQQEVHQPYRC